MLPISRNRKISTLLVTLPVCLAASLLGGCYGRDQLPYHAVKNTVHGKPRSVFVDPVGYRYPDIVQRTRASAYAPLPQIRRPGETLVPKARTGMAPKATTGDTMPVADAKPSLPAMTSGGMAPVPTVEVVPAMRDAAEGRATTQMRR